MMDVNESNNIEETSEGANGPVTVAKLKEYGKQAYGPLINVVYKYQGEFTPYLSALAKGLKSGGDSLNKEDSTEVEKYVSQFFHEAAEGLSEAGRKLESKDINEFTTFVNKLADKKPSIMFSTSYIAGLFFGRLGRHIISRQKSVSSEPPAFEQPLH